jgi:hypothetical protein
MVEVDALCRRACAVVSSGVMSGTVQPAAPLDDVVSDDADTMIHFEHPARAEEFAAVAVLATLAYEADETGSALPPLWPMVLHSSFTDLILPVPGAGADASSSDAASIPELIRALRSLIPRHQHGGALGIRRVLYARREEALIDDIIDAALCRCSHDCLGVELRLMQRSSKPRGHLRSSRLRANPHTCSGLLTRQERSRVLYVLWAPLITARLANMRFMPWATLLDSRASSATFSSKAVRLPRC